MAKVEQTTDGLGRPEISWTNVALRLPDDGAGALPLLRHVILVDDKSSTYKLGLLRSLCRVADGAAGLACQDGDDVSVPLGLIALIWLRLYLPLLRADLPQSPINVRGVEKLGFAKESFAAVLRGAATGADLQVGARLGAEAAMAVHGALRAAVDTIATNPAKYVSYPNESRPVFQVARASARPPDGPLVLTGAYLASFGSMRVSHHVWQALQRYAAWVEPSLVAEWIRLMRGYADRQGRRLDEGAIGAAMTWSDPARDVLRARTRALSLIQEGETVRCVWSGKRLEISNLDVDHCVPWSAWPCGDLWNLLPAHRTVNQREKRDRLPSAAALLRAEDQILGWWKLAYLPAGDALTAARFVDEAQASLPALRAEASTPAPEDVFDAVGILRLRLHRDQQVPEWDGSRKGAA